MSGPKSITYTVTPEIWEQLCEMRRKERKLHSVWNCFYEQRQRLATLCLSLRELAGRLSEVSGEFPAAEEARKETEAVKERAEAALEQVRDITMDYGSLSGEEKTSREFGERTGKLRKAGYFLYEVIKDTSKFLEKIQSKEEQLQIQLEEQRMEVIKQALAAGEEEEKEEYFVPDDDERQEMIQAYVSRCIDEVMEEMGYELSGMREVTKRSGRHFKNELFSYSDGCVISMTASDDGRIAMELGGLAKEDREPLPEEQEYLSGEMEEFCHDFSEFERRLWERGVIPKNRLSMLPPSGAYAQIINTEDFEMVKELPLLDTSRNRKKKGKAAWQR